MAGRQIKNVVFDVGNVLVRWSPDEITRLTFGASENTANQAAELFQGDIWSDLNRGRFTEAEATLEYQRALGLTSDECARLFYYVKHTQLLLYGSVDLLSRIKAAGYGVFALTDNVREVVEHLRHTHGFWPLFDGATVSADVGTLKPDPHIYQTLLSTHALRAAESVFIDDMPYNVRGAEAVGMAAIQFENAAQCERSLIELGLEF